MAEFKSITLQGEEILCKDETARNLAYEAGDEIIKQEGKENE